jgi:hypothetical protein
LGGDGGRAGAGMQSAEADARLAGEHGSGGCR